MQRVVVAVSIKIHLEKSEFTYFCVRCTSTYEFEIIVFGTNIVAYEKHFPCALS